jgi:hypothetical protein
MRHHGLLVCLAAAVLVLGGDRLRARPADRGDAGRDEHGSILDRDTLRGPDVCPCAWKASTLVPSGSGETEMNRHSYLVLTGLLLAAPSLAQEERAVQEDMVAVISALLATVQQAAPTEAMLGVERKANLVLPADDPQRENWQYWPTVRVGLPLEYMSAVQRRLVHDLLRTLLSSNGYLKATHIMRLEEILDVLDEAGLPRSVDHYRLVVFGTPSAETPWSWRFEGHHVSLNVAVSPEGVSVTPSFFGANPAEVVGGPLAGFRVHGILEDLARELLMSLSDEQRAVAVVAERAAAEIYSGNINKDRAQWDAWRQTLVPQGVAVSELNEVQQHWVRRMLDEIVGNYRPELAARYLAGVDVEELSFAWMGPPERHAPHYFRLQGTDFMFEYDNVQNDGNHVHSVWRSKAQDFGQDVLGEHYRTSHLR